MIEVKKLNFRYPKCKADVLHDVSFSCKEGSINLFLGLNGSGKTTLIKLLAGLYTPKTGEIYYDSDEIGMLTVKERSRRIAYVAQKNNSIDDYSVREYLLFGTVNQMNFYQIPSNAQEEFVDKVAERLQIQNLLKKNLGEISGGERQIMSIASAMVQNTPYILLDEPTSALDIKNQHKVLSALKEIVENENKTVLLSSHNPNHALYLGAQVYLLKDGMLMASGAAADMVTVEMLKSIYGEHLCYSKELPYSEIAFID